MAFGGQMHDRVGLELADQGPHARRVANVGLDVAMERIALERRQRQRIGRIGHRVDIEHLVPMLAHQQVDQGRTDKAGPAGHNDAHGWILS